MPQRKIAGAPDGDKRPPRDLMHGRAGGLPEGACYSATGGASDRGMSPTPSDPPALPHPVPEISVVIAHLNQPDLLGRCLAALARQSLAPDLFEVIVVDNGSREERPQESVAAVVARFPGVVLAHEGLPGPGPARNRGAGLARGAILAFTDADCVPEPGWLAAIHARLAAEPGLGILGGRVQIFPERPEDITPAEAFQMVYAFRQENYINRQGFSVTANLAVRRAVFAAVGPFAGLELSEDKDWGHRATRAGHRIAYAPEARVLHPARRSMAELRGLWDRHMTHFYRLARGPLGRIRWVATIPVMALSPLAGIPAILRARGLGPRGRWRAFQGLVAIRLYRAGRMAAMLGGAPDGAARWNR